MTAPSLLDELEGVAPGELDETAPPIVWLQIDTDGSNDDRGDPWPGRDGVTWCDESIGGLEIQYVRADLYRDMAKRLEAAERDAARYRWLRADGADQEEVTERLSVYMRNRTGLDAAIDAATQEGEG